MLRFSFQKLDGQPGLGIAFFWQLRIEGDAREPIQDRLIPELFYDFLYVQRGTVSCLDVGTGTERRLPAQSLKTIHTRPVTLRLSTPLVLLGARLSLSFAERFWEPEMPSNQFLAQNWGASAEPELASFAARVIETIQQQRTHKTDKPMLATTLEETDWLAHFSDRHKRRLYRSVFGISKKEMRAIQGLHAFLGRTCDFSSQRPRIIEYIDTDVFYDQPHLNRTFRKMTGMSPLEFLQAGSILQDNLMAASYNESGDPVGTIDP